MGWGALSPSRGQLCCTTQGSLQAAGMDAQCREMPWAASVPKGCNKASCQEGTRAESRGRWGKQREGRGKLPGSSPSPWPAQRQLPVFSGTSRLPGLPSPCRRALAPSRDGKGRSLNAGLLQNIGRTRASLVGGRLWQCCVRGLRGGTASPGCPCTMQGAACRDWD